MESCSYVTPFPSTCFYVRRLAASGRQTNTTGPLTDWWMRIWLLNGPQSSRRIPMSGRKLERTPNVEITDGKKKRRPKRVSCDCLRHVRCYCWRAELPWLRGFDWLTADSRTMQPRMSSRNADVMCKLSRNLIGRMHTQHSFIRIIMKPTSWLNTLGSCSSCITGSSYQISTAIFSPFGRDMWTSRRVFTYANNTNSTNSLLIVPQWLQSTFYLNIITNPNAQTSNLQ